MVRQAEEVERQMRELTLPKSVDEVKPSRRRKPRVAPSSHQSNTKSNSDRITQLSGPCSRCGYVKHFNDKCPAIDRRCNVCSVLGHYGSCCKSKSNKPKKARVNQLVSDASFLGEVDSKSDCWTQLVVVEGLDLPVRFKLDSGADVSVVPSRLCAHLTVRPTSKRLIAPGNMCITVLGEFDSVLTVGSRKHTERLHVVDQTNALLGREACVKLWLITCHVSHGEQYEHQMRDLHVQSKSIDAVKSQLKRRVASIQSDTNTQSEVYCPRCSYVQHNNSRCPAINGKCNFCGITGHYARCCRHKAQTRKHQHTAKVKQLLVDTDSDNVSFLGELVMGRTLRPNVTADPNVLQPKLPNAVHIRQKEVELKASSKFNFERKHRSNELPPLTVGDEV